MAKRIIDPSLGVSRRLQEYLLLPGRIPSGLASIDVDLSTPLTTFKKGAQPKLKLNIPVLSAPMQSVTGPALAIEIAKLGGAGVIYCSQSIDAEVNMARQVKSHKAGFVVPDVFSP